LDKILLALVLIYASLPFEPKEEDECKSRSPGWKERLLLPPMVNLPQNIVPYSNSLLPFVAPYGSGDAALPAEPEEDGCKRRYSGKKECESFPMNYSPQNIVRKLHKLLLAFLYVVPFYSGRLKK